MSRILSVHRDVPEPYAVVEMDEEPYVTIREYWIVRYIPTITELPDDREEIIVGRTATLEDAKAMASTHRARYNHGHGLVPESWGDCGSFSEAHIKGPRGGSYYSVDRYDIPHEPEPKSPLSLAEAAEAFREARTRANEATDQLRAAVLRKLATKEPEAAVARAAGVDRMTVRRWAGKLPKERSKMSKRAKTVVENGVDPITVITEDGERTSFPDIASVDWSTNGDRTGVDIHFNRPMGTAEAADQFAAFCGMVGADPRDSSLSWPGSGGMQMSCPNCGEVVGAQWVHWQVFPGEGFRCELSAEVTKAVRS